MIISLLTDAPKHNLALMKLSTYYKQRGGKVHLNKPLWPADKRYASILFDWNVKKFIADEYGGPGYNFEPLNIDCRPDYSLYGLDFSLGFTYRYCPRNCGFCKVTKMEKDKNHKSIWDFHLPRFKKICLLNNNTFFDPYWRETFEEIWDAKLIVRDENGYDLRLVDEEKAIFLKKTQWDHGPKFAWDRMEDEKEILKGFEEINRVGFKGCTIYVLIGYNTTLDQDIYRCQKIHDLGHNPFPMIYKETPVLRKFRRMIYLRYYRKEGNIEKAWRNYSK
jgi:hypothetical protein